MASPILPISGIAMPEAARPAAQAAGRPDEFKALLHSAVNQVEELRHNADQTVNRFLSGEGEELHRAALATQRAELAFDMFMQVRNKVVAAYQEVMRMQL